MLLDAGANVIMTTKGIDDMALKYFVEANAIALRRVKKDDLRRIAKLTGGTLMITFADMEGNESFPPEMLGTADEVIEERVGGEVPEVGLARANVVRLALGAALVDRADGPELELRAVLQ